MADLATRWGVTPNTVSRRLSFLGLKPIRQGNFRFLTPEQLHLAEQLHQHVLSGKPQESFPRSNQGDGGRVVRRVQQSPQVSGLVPAEQMAALAAALQPVDPLRRARGLTEAADHGLVLTNDDLSSLLGQGVGRWGDGHEAYGYCFGKHKQGNQVLWTVSRAIAPNGGPPIRSLPSGGTSPTTSRQVGFGAVIEASYRVIDDTGSRIFAIESDGVMANATKDESDGQWRAGSAGGSRIRARPAGRCASSGSLRVPGTTGWRSSRAERWAQSRRYWHGGGSCRPGRPGKCGGITSARAGGLARLSGECITQKGDPGPASWVRCCCSDSPHPPDPRKGCSRRDRRSEQPGLPSWRGRSFRLRSAPSAGGWRHPWVR